MKLTKHKHQKHHKPKQKERNQPTPIDGISATDRFSKALVLPPYIMQFYSDICTRNNLKQMGENLQLTDVPDVYRKHDIYIYVVVMKVGFIHYYHVWKPGCFGLTKDQHDV